MTNFEKNNTLWQILLWWGSWHIIAFFLGNGYEHLDRFFVRVFANVFVFAMVVFVNLNYLLPKFFFPKKIFLFIISGILLLLLAIALLYGGILPMLEWLDLIPTRRPLSDSSAKGPPIGIRWIVRFTPYIITFLGSTTIEVVRFANQKEKETIRLEKEKLDSELKFLKSQVNPHFLFNALNNIYSLAVIQAPQTPESVMQLSEILRYMVYDSNEEKVSLKNEINYINNFVDLKKLKDSRGMNIELDLEDPPLNLKIVPLLLIPFVENAFKHSKIENLKEGFIRISLSIKDKWIDFQVVNSVPKVPFTKDEVGGVGLDNTKKRLQLLYPNGQHELNIKKTDDEFKVVLKIAI